MSYVSGLINTGNVPVGREQNLLAHGLAVFILSYTDRVGLVRKAFWASPMSTWMSSNNDNRKEERELTD